MRKYLLIFSLMFGLATTARATTLTGSLKNPDSTGFTGRLLITLSQQTAQLSTGGCGGPAVIVPTAIVSITVTNGAMIGSPTLVGNDCMTPSNTYYIVMARDGNGNILFKENWQVTGASEDVGTILPIIVTQGTASISQAYITNMALSGTLSGNPTVSGTPIFNNLFNVAGSQVATIASTKVFTNTTFDTAGTGNIFKVNGTQISDKTGTGKAVLDTSPTITGTDSGTETYQNKTLNGSANGNSVSLLDNQDPTSASTGTGADKTLYTYTIPANVVAAGKGIRVCAWSVHTTGSASVTYKLTLGSTTPHTHSASAPGAPNAYCVDIFNKVGVQNAQTTRLWMFVSDGTVAIPGAGVTLSENLANSLAVKFTFNVAATDQVTGKGWSVELLQ